MLGQSIYVSRFDESFIPEKNIDFYFTSMHIAEEFNDEFKNKALKLLKVLNEYNKKITPNKAAKTILFKNSMNINSKFK